ncbi:type II toxin-antitoxin system VapB family antitoxin [Cyanobium sp. ATX-6F1]
MNIKDERVHAMAKELASRRGTSVTNAVRQALAAELERNGEPNSGAALEARKQAMQALLARCRALPRLDPRERGEVERDLFDDAVLPW